MLFHAIEENDGDNEQVFFLESDHSVAVKKNKEGKLLDYHPNMISFCFRYKRDEESFIKLFRIVDKSNKDDETSIRLKIDKKTIFNKDDERIKIVNDDCFGECGIFLLFFSRYFGLAHSYSSKGFKTYKLNNGYDK